MPARTIADQPFSGDDGSAAPGVRDALTAYAAGRGSEQAALIALAGARLLVPVVALLTGSEEAPAANGGQLRRDKSSEMALPTLVGNDGRHAVLAFTGLDALTRWRPDARPVPVSASRVWEAGVQEADAVVIDIAGPVPIAVEGARLDALAHGRPVPLPHEDPDLIGAARAAVAGEDAVSGVRLLPGPAGGDLTVQLTVSGELARAMGGLADQGGGPGGGRPAGGPNPVATEAGMPEAIQRIATAIMAESRGRLRRGVAVTIVEG